MMPSPIQLAKDLFGIHMHVLTEDNETIIVYKEDDLLNLFTKWGWPVPDWDGHAKEYTAFEAKLREAYLLSPPGDTIKETMEATGMSIENFAKLMQVPTFVAEALLDGTKRISKEYALKLQQIFGIDAEFWRNRQRNYDLALAEACAKDKANDREA